MAIVSETPDVVWPKVSDALSSGAPRSRICRRFEATVPCSTGSWNLNYEILTQKFRTFNSKSPRSWLKLDMYGPYKTMPGSSNYVKRLCVWKHLETRWFGFCRFFLKQGARADGGGLWPTKTPPHPVKTYLRGKRLSQEPQDFQQWQEAKPRTSISKMARG